MELNNTDKLLSYRASRLKILEQRNWNALDKVKVVDHLTLSQLKVSDLIILLCGSEIHSLIKWIHISEHVHCVHGYNGLDRRKGEREGVSMICILSGGGILVHFLFNSLHGSKRKINCLWSNMLFVWT